MFTNKNLKFANGTILTGAMLHEIYKYPREFFRLIYKDFSDGIICGLDYFMDEGNLFLSAGIMKLDGEFYFLEKNLNFSLLAEKNNLKTDQKYYICLNKISAVKEPCLTENNFEIILSQENNFPTLGQFVFTKIDDFNFPILIESENPFERIFDRNAFNVLEVNFAAKGGATFHPFLFRLVKDFLLKKKDKTPLDYSILTQLQNAETISLQTIKSYIAEEGAEFNSGDRKSLFKIFCDCLVNSKFKLNYSLKLQEDEGEKNKRKFSPLGKLL